MILSRLENAGLDKRAVERLRAPFDDLARALSSAANGREIVFLRTDGNYGDAIIHQGTAEFFEDYALPWRILDMSSYMDKLKSVMLGGLQRLTGGDTLFVYSGGGGWSKACRVAMDNVERQLSLTSNLIVLPSSIECTLPTMPTIYARDLFQSSTTLPSAPFCHDMAFYLALIDPDRVLSNRTRSPKGLCLAFRTDNEARIPEASSHPANADISTWGSASTDTERFLRHLDQYEHVLTDRLHVAITATILGRQVSLVRNSYFKIEAIFRSSIEGIFPNCRLIDDEEALRLVRSLG